MKNRKNCFHLFQCSIGFGILLLVQIMAALCGPCVRFLSAVAVLLVFIVLFMVPLRKRKNLLLGFQKKQLTLNEIAAVMPDCELKGLIDSIIINYEKGYQADMLIRQAEIRYLQGQIKPHFLYNSLESIRGKAYIDGEMEIANMTEALAAYFRYSISQKGRMVTLAEEVNNIRHYFLIQQYRFQNRFSIEYLIEKEEIDLENLYIPKMTLQPLIENAISHGLTQKTGKGRIQVRMERSDQRVVLHISDDGCGMTTETVKWLNDITADKIRPQTERGMAIYNVDQRIKLYFGETFGLYFSSTEGFGTNVEVTIPAVDERWARSIEEKVNEI